ncbi:MAG: LPS-assembly protein LptD, partial [Porticoccaceae bacterium]|nr:LPS-assembly protein LptD [Porticoccaceae bacterium]
MPLAVFDHQKTIGRRASALLLALLALTPFSLLSAQESASEWNCSADVSGDWLCIEQTLNLTAESTVPRPTRSLNRKAANPDEPRVATVRNLDWVEETDMSEEQRAELDKNCCGAYIEPSRNYPDADLAPEKASLRVNANRTEAMSDDIAVLEGDVQISQGYRQVRSDSATVNQADRQVSLQGNVRFREPGMLLLGDNAKINIDSKEVQIENATYVLHEASVRGTAKTLSRNQEG